MSPWWEDYQSKPRRSAGGIKAQTTRGQFGKSWWAGRWIQALERLVDSARLSRGRSYARSGQVLRIELSPGQVDAHVQGSRPKPYKVVIHIAPLDDRSWEAVIDAMASQAIFAAKLLAGEMPQNIEEAFAAAGVSLFPQRSGDLQTDCSCPDWANPCKHVAAVYYLLGEQFDADPFLIFALRGRDKDRIIADLRGRRSQGTEPSDAKSAAGAGAEPPFEEQVPSLEECLDRFWTADEQREEALLRLHIPIAAPMLVAAAVKRLGTPPFWQGSAEFMPLMSHMYIAISKAALELAMKE